MNKTFVFEKLTNNRNFFFVVNPHKSQKCFFELYHYYYTFKKIEKLENNKKMYETPLADDCQALSYLHYNVMNDNNLVAFMYFLSIQVYSINFFVRRNFHFFLYIILYLSLFSTKKVILIRIFRF